MVLDRALVNDLAVRGRYDDVRRLDRLAVPRDVRTSDVSHQRALLDAEEVGLRGRDQGPHRAERAQDISVSYYRNRMMVTQVATANAPVFAFCVVICDE